VLRKENLVVENLVVKHREPSPSVLHRLPESLLGGDYALIKGEKSINLTAQSEYGEGDAVPAVKEGFPWGGGHLSP